MLKEIYWEKALSKTKSSITKNSLFPLNTIDITSQIYEGNDFIIRKLDISKLKKNKEIGPRVNPFRPWDKTLEIDSIGKYHHIILNKYPVQLGHILLITNDWKCQSGWLETDDFKAIKKVNNDTTGLWFFNSGPLAGASQPHRHIQLLRRNFNELNCPREKWFMEYTNNKNLNKKFSNNIVIKKFSSCLNNQNIYEDYLNLSNKLDLGSPKKDKQPKKPYNMLLTNKWMVLIKRKIDNLKGVSINALGFAGYLLITEKSNIKYIKEEGPEELLKNFI